MTKVKTRVIYRIGKGKLKSMTMYGIHAVANDYKLVRHIAASQHAGINDVQIITVTSTQIA